MFFLRHCIWFGFLLLVSLAASRSRAMEFMEDVERERDDTVMGLEQMDSAEMPTKLLTTYTRDTIAHFNPHKSDAGFRQLWERIPLEKAKDIIKR